MTVSIYMYMYTVCYQENIRASLVTPVKLKLKPESVAIARDEAMCMYNNILFVTTLWYNQFLFYSFNWLDQHVR